MIVSGEIAVERVVTGPLDANCYLVSAPNGDAVVVDAGDDAHAIAGRVAAGGLRPLAVLGTHAHHDHVGAAGELAERYGVPFGIHRAEARNLGRLNFCRRVFHDQEPVRTPSFALDLAASASLRFGTLDEIVVVHTPGHSQGSVCLEVGGLLLTGDTVLATRAESANMPGSDPEALAASVRGLLERFPPDTTILPGHGAPGRLADAAVETGGRA